MPRTCIVLGCRNRGIQGTGISFHHLPLRDPELLTKWVKNINRKWLVPAKHQVICSEHFLAKDYMRGKHPSEDRDVSHHHLLPRAVPTIFPENPPKERIRLVKKPPPSPQTSPGSQPSPRREVVINDNRREHDHASSIPAGQEQQHENASKRLKVINQKGQGRKREETIGFLLQEARENEMLGQYQLDMLQHNFGENAFALFEEELEGKDADQHSHHYSEELRTFAVTLQFYSSQTYAFLRSYFPLPRPRIVRQWSAGLNCQPGFLRDVIAHLKELVADDPVQAHCVLMFDAMAIEKEVVFDKETCSYDGFVDGGNFLPGDSDSLAKRALVFMAVGLTSSWEFPVAYYLVDYLPGSIQAEIIRQLICSLTEAGLVVHGVSCDGSYASQAIASSLGCSISPDSWRPYFSHPLFCEEKVNVVFDVCLLEKLVRHCLATMGDIYHDDKLISWSYIEKLYEIGQNDSLNFVDQWKAKHILWQQHRMNVKAAVHCLSSSVADAIDFLRNNLRLPQFAGSHKTSEFIRMMDKLINYMSSTTCTAKGFKKPMKKSNLSARSQWLMETKAYLSELRDRSGQLLTMGSRKTAWLGFMTTIESVVQICQDLLTAPQAVTHVCTYKMSQDPLQMFFSQIQCGGDWSCNPNALQFKSALQAVLQKNGIAQSEKASASMEKPSKHAFFQVVSCTSYTIT